MHNLEANSTIPTFILKLWKLVSDEESNDLICWNRSGRSFIINDQSRFAKELLPLYFKHSNMASFIRQLNMYGFRKLSNIESGGLKSDGDEIEFFHQFFNLEDEKQLGLIKRKMSNNSRSMTSIVKVDELNDIIGDVESMKGRQDSVDSMLNQMKRENEALWREVAMLRQKHLKQQQIVEKLLNFLVSIVRNRVIPAGIKRKQAPLLIDSDGNSVAPGNNLKLMKTSGSENYGSPGASGPIIHDITELDDALNDGSLDLNFGDEDNQQTQERQQKQLNQQQATTNMIVNSPISILSDGGANVGATDIMPTADNSIVPINEIPDNFLNFDLDEVAAESGEDAQIDVNAVLNTPVMRTDSPRINHNGGGDNNANTSFSANNNNNNNASGLSNPLTDLIISKSAPTLIDPNEPLSSDVFNDHLDGIDAELGWLHDQLYDNSLQIDPSKILELFQSEQQFLPDQLEQPKALTSSSASASSCDNNQNGSASSSSNVSNSKMIKTEKDRNDQDDFVFHQYDTKDMLSGVDFDYD